MTIGWDLAMIDDSLCLSWGLPAQITQAKSDRQCPICNARPNGVEYSNNRLISGFEIGKNGKYGLCACGFAFETG